MKFFLRDGGLTLMIFILGACIEPYDPPVKYADVNRLVADGFLNATEGVATVKLTRTLPLKSSENMPAESGAAVRIEDDKGVFYPLSETGEGVYSGTVLNTNTENLYRLVFRTNDNKEYASDFVEIKHSPAIDSVAYSFLTDGVEFSVNTHDPTGESRHYRWKYVETYEYNSNFNSLFMFSGDEIIFRPHTLSLYTCWKTNLSTGILVSTTKHLQESVVSKFPITFIPKGSLKISAKYSLLVQQQALTDEAYDYWLNLEKNTEQLGGLFDPLPSQAPGNIHSTTNPAEEVIGFFSGSTVQEARIFLGRSQLPRSLFTSSYNPDCSLDTVFVSETGDIYKEVTLLVDAVYAPGAGIIGYTVSRTSCVDCTALGGTTTKPAFWE